MRSLEQEKAACRMRESCAAGSRLGCWLTLPLQIERAFRATSEPHSPCLPVVWLLQLGFDDVASATLGAIIVCCTELPLERLTDRNFGRPRFLRLFITFELIKPD